ncbi:DUF72 domain-containing protein [Levilactobacillus brevis]|jgi:uncharacterized protein YecE (DUF72 family)|uniref:DUF72 domain-containing protein n=3 Tax=Levilactobacillus brevis TaxID=1580 RepID=Q03T60_LEVBA|nr:DUF72 domain-containing protein [Levilactobacillus brevis]MBL3537488.1 DUF72 domain-containing protein [Lactobacillus sp. GPR40-2]MBL3630633.1 DUF72 domain-containing protein [Lactobacillus sp. GPB7-4]ABJ63612.1 hypothetical protein LVIS_0454 [Levilactobacillus brevis ATCC 367]ARQ93353.1 hypothetical protein A6F60_06390 [Levilactobacillus brevis]ARW21370.1 UPF0759 protein YunF [Levilactobacillus brevis]
MITIGLTTWKEHPALIGGEERPVTLTEYAGRLPVVELDTPFYGIPRQSTVANWQAAVPDGFQYILKANQVMTRHDRQHPLEEAGITAAFDQFIMAIQPMVTAGKLMTVLFQFPPFFNRTTANIQYLRDVRLKMGKLPVAVEFRSPSWFETPGMTADVMAYLQSLKLTNVTTDEPHNLNDGIPLVETVTTPELAVVRLHGRNAQGWFNQGTDWRKTRTLYRYSEAELQDIAALVKRVAQHAQQVCVIFNNNSAKDAAPNALRLQKILGLHWQNLAPQQLDLF